jgi:tetratricopeptide (TPR) repeat protein
MTRPIVGPAGWIARGLMVAVWLAGATPAIAQSTGMVKGKVVDGNNQIVDGAKVLIEYRDGMNRKFEVKTNKKGEFLQIGLPPGNWSVTASKEGVGVASRDVKVSIGATEQVDLTLAVAAPGGGTLSKEEAAFQKLFEEGVAASQGGKHDLAIERYLEALKAKPSCYSCQYNLGLSYLGKKDTAKAEAAFLEASKLKPDAAEPYSQLANIYDEQKNYEKAKAMMAESVKRSGATAGGTNAATLYNQGVMLIKGGNMGEARAAFEAAIKAKPDYADAYYLLASAYVNQGQFKEAVSAYESYLKHAPAGDNPRKLEDAKNNIAALKPLIK